MLPLAQRGYDATTDGASAVPPPSDASWTAASGAWPAAAVPSGVVRSSNYSQEPR